MLQASQSPPENEIDLAMGSMGEKRALIIGAGPAGLTAAYELLTRTKIRPIILEKSSSVGGLSRSVNYKGNRIDIGGHRFFSKSDRVIQWWLRILPLQSMPAETADIYYQGKTALIPAGGDGLDPERHDRVMLVRNRKSRIYFRGRLFEYPISLTYDTFKKLGPWNSVRIGFSYIRSRLLPIRNETNLEQFLINRFGRRLYVTFFKAYTEKVWGVECRQISADWGLQRIKGLSLSKMCAHAIRKLFRRQVKDIETSLIERFMYPKFGPGQMWEEVANQIQQMGGQVLTQWTVDKIEHDRNSRVLAVHATNTQTGESRRLAGDYIFSTMPVKELVAAMSSGVPSEVREIAEGLQYRDFITVGVLCKRLKLREHSGEAVKDNWIYIQEPNVFVGRIQIFNNWSPAMTADPSTTWIGLEYFCNETDEFWRKTDSDLIELAKAELVAMNIVEPQDIQDVTIIREAKAYPAYFGSYNRFSEVSSWVDRFENLFLIGRNGMHKYNNQDHSMLTAMTAVDNIISNSPNRENLWSLNTEQEYHEARHAPAMTT
jgi:protoporphyrinogen oxidase